MRLQDTLKRIFFLRYILSRFHQFSFILLLKNGVDKEWGVSASTVRTKLKKGDWMGTHRDQRLSGEDRGLGARVVLGRVASLGSDKCRLRVSMKIENPKSYY